MILMNKKDYRNLGIIIALILIYIIINLLCNNSYISKVDYISQHFRIPEYLRTLFYSNGSIFPSFALNLGAGQNIYYLAYHGLLSPITLFSYLLPFVRMQDYMVVINIVLLILSIIFFYKWLRKKFDITVSTTVSFIFAFSGPLIYHTHRHIMFNNYMLFLVLGLIFTDLYFEKGKKSPLIITIFLIIMTSFYYSILSIVTICIYALYRYLNTYKKIEITAIIKKGLDFISTILIAVLMASILLLPTLYAIKNGRSDTLSSVSFLNTLIPSFDINRFFYQSYSVGICSIFIYAIVNLFISKKKSNIVLGFVSSLFLVFPFICFCLNGFMYLDGKCFIPLLPLFCLVIGIFLDDLKKKNYNYNVLFIVTYIVMIIIAFTNLGYKYMFIFVIDNACVFLGLMLYKYRHKYWLLQIPIICFCIMVCLSTNLNDRLVKRDVLDGINQINDSIYIDYNKNYRISNTINLLENVNNVLDKDYYTTSIYSSLENKYYTNFIRNVFKNDIYNKDYHTITNTNNVLFNMYMGNYYLISDKDEIGYEKISDYLYQNDDVFGIGYSNDKLMSKKEFDELNYPYSIDALMNYTIIDKDIDYKYKNDNIKEYSKDIDIVNSDISYIRNNGMYIFDAIDEGSVNLKLDDSVKDKILIIMFDMNFNDKIDTSIDINGIRNTLSYNNWKYHNNNYTFHYVISNTNNLDISVSKGHYEINNIKIYELDYNNYKFINNNHDMFNIINTHNKIEGNINVSNDGYFNLSIPYDKGFNIKVDGRNIDYELINTAFIGFRINKGYHSIVITYTPPYAKIASLISLIGVIIFIVFVWRDLSEKD